ncbi:hypothetical protein HaLaN_08943 [Haematococcus lacustris]|uniref:Uncharacterized protein n=1 Tax=Haematococcus lacustris TaxID=44745 RepID=A0A699ZCC2_HAELA|nr:hypothetical protein HaLaN_08943 [Haematococcus lacustris]
MLLPCCSAAAHWPAGCDLMTLPGRETGRGCALSCPSSQGGPGHTGCWSGVGCSQTALSQLPSQPAACRPPYCATAPGPWKR